MNLILPTNNDTVGNQLSAINNAFEILDTELTQLLGIMNQTLIPLLNFYKSNQAVWTNAITIAPTLSAEWSSMATTVATNSAAWLPPLTVVYPLIVNPTPSGSFSQNYTFLYETIPQWLNTIYPITDLSGNILRMDGQIALVTWSSYYIDVNAVTSILKQINTATHCIGYIQGQPCNANGVAYAVFNCATKYSGILGPGNNYTWCDPEGLVNCNYTLQCPFGQEVSCMFETPGGFAPSYDSIITSNITLTKDPVRIDTLTTSTYQIRGCRWIKT